MKMQIHPRPILTLGEFITSVFDTCAASKAGAIVRLALETQRVLLRGNPPPVWQPHRSATRSPGRALRRRETTHHQTP